MQPTGRLDLPDGFSIDLPVLIDTGVGEMLLWLSAADRPSALAELFEIPGWRPDYNHGSAVVGRPCPTYSFMTGDASNPAAPSAVEWRNGKGINTGRHILASSDYLYDAARGMIGFRSATTN